MWLIESDVFQIPRLHKHSNVAAIIMSIQLRIIICFIFTTQLLFNGCKSDPSKKVPVSNPDTSTAISIESVYLKKVDTIPIKSKKQIIGPWLDLGKEELTLDISTRTFYYREHHERFKYQFDKDTIRIFYREVVVSGRPNFIGDTLLICASNGYTYKYLKIKEQQ